MAPQQVIITWNWLNWQSGFKWKRDISPQLCEVGITEEQLARCVYVIRVNGLFAIQYPKGISPTLYIGEGNFKNRIIQHRNWMAPLIDLVGEFPFQIGICIPRVRNSRYAYRDFEAALLMEFREIYGCAPMKNSQMEKRRANYEYAPKQEIRSAIMIGQGVRYHWAVSPMKSSPYYDHYWRTHD